MTLTYTPEQKARELLKCMDLSQLDDDTETSFDSRIDCLSNNTVRELADLIASHERLLDAVKRTPVDFSVRTLLVDWWYNYGVSAIDNAWKPD